MYGEEVVEDPGAPVPAGRIGEPVAADPGPEFKPPDGLAKPMEPVLPVALTYPLATATLVELKSSINNDFHCCPIHVLTHQLTYT